MSGPIQSAKHCLPRDNTFAQTAPPGLSLSLSLSILTMKCLVWKLNLFLSFISFVSKAAVPIPTGLNHLLVSTLRLISYTISYRNVIQKYNFQNIYLDLQPYTFTYVLTTSLRISLNNKDLTKLTAIKQMVYKIIKPLNAVVII